MYDIHLSQMLLLIPRHPPAFLGEAFGKDKDRIYMICNELNLFFANPALHRRNAGLQQDNAHSKSGKPGLRRPIGNPQISIRGFHCPCVSSQCPDASLQSPSASFQCHDASMQSPDVNLQCPDVSPQCLNLSLQCPDARLQGRDVSLQ